MYTEQEIENQKELVTHYLELQRINQEIINSNNMNFFTKSVLSKQLHTNDFGYDGLSLAPESSFKHSELLFGSLVFAASSVLAGPILALPIAIATTGFYDSLIIKNTYRVINQNQLTVLKAVDFYFEHEALFTSNIHNYGYSRYQKRETLSNKEALDIYLNLFSDFRKALHSFKAIDTYEDKYENVNVVNNTEQSLSEKLQDNKDQLLIISDDILFDQNALEKLYTEKGSVSEVELLSTISQLENELDNGFDLARAEKISNEILPSLKSAVEFQSNSSQTH